MEDKVILKILFCLIVLFLLTGISEVFAGDRIYSGRVIDADTKEPIESAVVLAVWHKEGLGIAGSHSRFKDVKETLTDKDGKWSIDGPEGEEDKLIPGLLQFVGVWMTKTPTFIVFKPGYCSWSFSAFSIDACKGKLKPRGNDGFIKGETVEVPKLTKREDRLRNSSIWPSLMDSDKENLKKIRNFLKLLDKENINLGLSGDPRLRELENEK